MDAAEYISLLNQLETQIPLWPIDECSQALGILERLRVSAWSRMLGEGLSLKTASRQPRGQLLTLPQIAERLTVPKTYAYELARQNRLPVIRLGKYVRVSAEEFEKWLSQQTSLERRIDIKPSAFHSGVGRNKRANPGQSRTPFKLEAQHRVGVGPHIAPDTEASEEKAGK